ncbi:hypothetical protein [Serratia rubidaea]|uniref:hypothetical protein n=1 Tax=Serratia rubidaea TaxID=61652 RepID=UPI001BAFAE39|nr:hypothetical protein [Serratia rubidaea]MBS0972857.1 hypothetical protein [Serratia rubidaea]
MSEISTLTIKIPLELKEKVRAAAMTGECSLSAEVCRRLTDSFAAPAAGQSKAVEIDSSETAEVVEAPLSQKELRKLRQLLKVNGKNGKKK